VPDTADSKKSALLAGATGLVGAHCLRQLVRNEAFTSVVAVARRPLELSDPKLQVLQADFARLDQQPAPRADVGLCALGTTIKKAGSQPAFIAVDRDAVVAFARWAQRGGCRSFVLVSSVGADAGARNFYLRVKGEAERSIAALGFQRFVALRPSLILGERADRRPGERVAQAMMPLVAPLLVGALRRYRGVSAASVAAALIAAAQGDESGVFVWEHDQIQAHAAAGA
jgi:uncharacterized protein YbjT (DUF2867 family)